MSISFRPINNSDKKRMAPSENSIIKNSPMVRLETANSLHNNVVSSSIFGKQDHSDDPNEPYKVYEDKYTRVGYIPLVKPVLNPFLSGRKVPVWRKVLGLKETEILPIINGECLYDLQEQQEVRTDVIGTKSYDPERYLFGTDYLVKLLDEVDLHQRLNDVLWETFIEPVLKTTLSKWVENGITVNYYEMYKKGGLYIGKIKKLPKDRIFDIIQGSVEGWCYGDFYLDMSEGDLSEEQREAVNMELQDVMAVDITELNQFPIISLLVSLTEGEGKELLKSQILDYVFVLPYGFRPTIENRVDALTSQYNKLVAANLELRDILNQYDKTIYTVLNKYKEIVQLVRNIFIGDDQVIKLQRLKDYKSLSDIITGKEGLMRGRMQGARVDNSGRAVITCDPEMPIDTIGVPRKMLYKVAEPCVIRGLRNYKSEEAQQISFKGRNLSTFSTASNTDKYGITYEEYLDKWFEEEDRYGIPGRQPTLFYLGMQAFKIKPVDGDAIVLSPLVVMPFNADFDGDQMHFNMPITKKAIKEVKERMSFTNNIRYPKNGEITVVTRHEIIYGLWICNVKNSSKDAVHRSKSDIIAIGERLGLPSNHGLYRIVYDAVCKQAINVYDTVEVSDKVITAGNAALEYAMTGGNVKLPYLITKDDIYKKIIKDKNICHTLEDDDKNKRRTSLVRSLCGNILMHININAYNSIDSGSVRNLLSEFLENKEGLLNPDIASTKGSVLSNLMDYIESGYNLSNIKITSKSINNILTTLSGNNSSIFLNAINRIVRLGFAVAGIWPPNISTIVPKDIEDYIRNKVREFNEKVIAREELLNIGLEIEAEYTTYFNNEWNALKKHITKYLLDNLNKDNGYISMFLSGGKGNESNIQQIFGVKGKVQKNDITSFNSIISGNYAGQLTGLEHLVTAYGSRRGIADKVLATAEPGYLSRKLEHTGCITSITWDDCETSQGIEFSLEDIVPFIEQSQISKYGTTPSKNDTAFYKRNETKTQLLAARDYLAKIIEGRYCVNEDGSSTFIRNNNDAINFIHKHWGHYEEDEFIHPIGEGIVTMRSPVYCNRPCCRKCYGRDIAAGKDLPDVGRPVGFIAAQAIGEPGTQMTMKNFQKGGVVSDANLTSSFELIEDYFELRDFSKKKRSKRGVYSYDVISPVEGFVKEQHLGNGSKLILVTKTNHVNDRKNLIPGTRKIILHSNTKCKKYVRVGDSFQEIQGNLNIKEVLEYRGYDKAVSYLCLNLFNIFETQDVNFKHFETIVAGMSCGILLTDAESSPNHPSIPYGEGSQFKAGTVMTLPEIKYGSNTTVPSAVKYTLIGLKNLPKYKSDFIESILMENMDSYIPRAILMNPNDSMTNPITLTAFGLPIGIGSDLSQ